MTAHDVLQRWFDAHERGDLTAAASLLLPDAEISVPGAKLHGFDAFMQWYRSRAETEGATFRYVVEDVLSGDRHAAAVMTLSTDDRTWRQVALYRVEGDYIAAIWAAEDSD